MFPAPNGPRCTQPSPPTVPLGIATAAYEDVISIADHAWRAGTELNPETALEIYETAIQRALTRSAYDDIAILAGHALRGMPQTAAQTRTAATAGQSVATSGRRARDS